MPVVLKHSDHDPLSHRERHIRSDTEHIPLIFVAVFLLIALVFAFGLLSLRQTQAGTAGSDELSSLSSQADSLDRGY